MRHEGATALVERPEGLVARDHADDPVDIPLVLALGRGLHLREDHVVDHAPVGPHLAVPGEHVLDGQFPHLGRDRVSIVRPGRRDGAKVVADRRIGPRLERRRHRPVPVEEPVRPFAGRVIEIPIEPFGEGEALRGAQTQGVGLAQGEEKCREALSALGTDAEFGGLGDRTVEVPARVREGDDLRARRLGLKQIAGEIRRAERVAHRADDAAPMARDEGRRIGLEGVPEGIIGGDEEPGVAALPNQFAGRGVGQGIGVVDPMLPSGEQALPVKAEVAAPVATEIRFFSLAMSCTASATAELTISKTAPTPSTSNQRRAVVDPMSALF